MSAKTKQPQEGIYYVVREPTGWKLEVHLSAPGTDRNHTDMWEEDIVPGLAEQWDRQLAGRVPNLKRLLTVLAFCFPRGRVTKVKSRFIVYHGNDLCPFMGVSRSQIEAAFGIAGASRWEYDDHERCVDFEKEEIRHTFALTEDWPAATMH